MFFEYFGDFVRSRFHSLERPKETLKGTLLVFKLKKTVLYAAFPILNILVPQTSQIASVAGLPFFIVTAFLSLPSRDARHLTQYIAIFKSSPPLSRTEISDCE
jgi:hypothetical protein